MQETASRVTTTDGVQLKVTIYRSDSVAAKNVPVRSALLLHGWANAAGVWREFAEAMILADPTWRLYATDQRGFGDSDKPDGGYTTDRFATDAVEAAATLFAGGDWDLIGHSMGGKFAQVAAARQPTGLRHLVLLTPSALKTEPRPDSARQALRDAYGDAEGIRRFLSGLPAHALRESRMNSLVSEGLATSSGAWNAWIDTIRDEDFAEVADAITATTLVVAGGKDALTSVADLRTGVADRITGARLETLPRSGHLPHLEEPEALAGLVVNFLEDSLPPVLGG